jgi:prophage antirepressor-like protein
MQDILSENLESFNFEKFTIRTFIIDNEPWFIAKDIFEVLDISSKGGKSEAIASLEVDELSSVKTNLDTQVREFKIVSESGLYALVLRSRKPIARPFQKWVTREVLPQIRKTGSYSIETKVETKKPAPQISLEIVETGIQILTKFRDLNPVEQIELDTFHKNKNGESLLEQFGKNFENSYFLPTELGKFLGMSGAEINLILEKKGFQFRDENGIWRQTSSGKEFCLEIGNKFDQLKWQIFTIL